MKVWIAIECGQRFWRKSSWKRYSSSNNLLRFRRYKSGFAFGPVMFGHRF